MKRLKLPVGSVEGIETRVSVDDDETDPTSFTVEYALVDPALATPASWSGAEWVVDPVGPPFYARSVVTVASGAKAYWLRISGGGETVIRRVGIVEGI